MKRWEFWGCLLILSILWAIFFFPALTFQGYFYHEDLFSIIMPLRALAAEQWRAGIIPLWDPYSFAGFPLLAEGQAAVFYPLSFLYVFLSIPTASNCFILTQFYLAAVAMLIFLKRLKLRAFAALIGAVAYGFATYFIINLSHINIIIAVSLAPLTFSYIIRATQERSLRDFIRAGFCFGLALLGGVHPSNVYLIIMICLFLIAKYVNHANRDGVFSSAKFLLSGLILFILTSSTFAAIQILPTAELTHYSIRQAVASFEQATSYSMIREYYPTLIMPYFWGNPAQGTFVPTEIFWEFCGYGGILTLVLAFYALIFRRCKWTYFFAMICALALILITGKDSWLSFIFHLPGATLFRAPARFLFIHIFGLSVLAALGMDYLLTTTEKGRNIKHFGHLPIIGIGIISLVVAMFVKFLQSQVKAIVMAQSWLLLLLYEVIDKWCPQGLEPVDIAPNVIALMLDAFGIFLFLFGISLIILALYQRRLISKPVFFVLALLLLYGDLYWAGAHFCPTVKSQRLAEPFWGAKYLLTHDGPEPPNRLATFVGAYTKLFEKTHYSNAVLSIHHAESIYQDQSHNTPMFRGIPSLMGCSPLETKNHYRLEYSVFLGYSNSLYTFVNWSDLDSGLTDKSADEQVRFGLDKRRQVLSMANVEYLLTSKDFTIPGWEQVPELGPQGQHLYRNPDCLPRAYWTSRAVPSQDTDSALRDIVSNKVNIRYSTILTGLESELGKSVDSTQVHSAAIKWLEYKPNRVRLNVNVKTAGVLVLADSYFPGWQARIDDKKAQIYPANSYFRGLIVQPGNHEVVFEYKPISFRLGMWISIISTIFWIGMLLKRCR